MAEYVRTPYEKALDRDARSVWEVAQPIFRLCDKLPPHDAKVAIAGVAMACRLLEAIELLAGAADAAADTAERIERQR